MGVYAPTLSGTDFAGTVLGFDEHLGFREAKA
jgi:hypothetical protein